MLRSVKELIGYTLHARDGDVGSVYDLYIDDRAWVIRYLVADTGTWLPGRKVLLSPMSLGEPDWADKKFPVQLTREKIENSPDISEHIPVSRQHEKKLHMYYGWPAYWSMGYSAEAQGALAVESSGGAATGTEIDEPDLRSASEVVGYHIESINGSIGHVEDFIVDDKDWVIRYIVVDTRNWLPGRKVIISPQWVRDVRWADRSFTVALRKEAIEESPEYDPYTMLDREYESKLFDHYGMPKYWV